MQPIAGQHPLSLSLPRGQGGEWDLRGLLSTKEGHSTFFGTHVLFWSYPKAGKIETHIGGGQREWLRMPVRPLIRPPRGGSSPKANLELLPAPLLLAHMPDAWPQVQGWTSGAWKKIHLKTQMHFPGACPEKILEGGKRRISSHLAIRAKIKYLRAIFSCRMSQFVKIYILCLWDVGV